MSMGGGCNRHSVSTTGRVCSTGTTDDGVVGGSVMAHINLPPILLEPIPSAARAKVQALCQPRSTAASRALIRQRVKACEVMGIPQTELPQPLCVAPTFMYDATRKTVQLVSVGGRDVIAVVTIGPHIDRATDGGDGTRRCAWGPFSMVIQRYMPLIAIYCQVITHTRRFARNEGNT